MPTRHIKARAQQKLHRRGQCKLPQRREHPVLAQHVAQHGQHQRHTQRQAPSHRRKPGPGACFWRVNSRICRLGLVTGIAHRSAQQSFHLRGLRGIGWVRNAGRFSGQVHIGALHAGHALERFFHPANARRAGHTAHTDVQGTHFRGRGAAHGLIVFRVNDAGGLKKRAKGARLSLRPRPQASRAKPLIS